tara:strand:- start:357 stop:533 length:177 start_codon:yes stop_codon:yes gene_type:complete
MEILFGIIFCSIAGFFVYMMVHIQEEERQGKQIPLFWEREKRKLFDKSDLEYKDGDNT